MAKDPLHATETNVTRTVAAIYAAAIAPRNWTDALEELRNTFGLGSAALLMHNNDRSRADGIAIGVERQGHLKMLGTLFRESVFHTRENFWYSGQIARSSEIVPTKVLLGSRLYQEYWKPRDLFHGLRLTVEVEKSGIHHAINLFRPKSGLVFEAAEIAVARALMPHLQRAVELARHLRHSNMLAAAALSALDTLPEAILLLDQAGRVLHTNATADSLLSKADALKSHDRVLHAATQASTNKLHAVLARAAGVDGGIARAGALRLHRPVGRPLALLAMPFRQEAEWSLFRDRAVLVCVSDPDAVTVSPGVMMAEMFGLTDAEATLAADLLAGGELRDIAARRRRSINTVRTHLSGLMAKMDVNRQSELMRLMGSLPRLTSPF